MTGIKKFFKSLILKIKGLLTRFVMVGEIDNRFFGKPLVIDSPEFGKSTKYPMVLEIDIEDKERPPAGIGEKVNEIFFKDRKRMLFNVCFSCGKGRMFGRDGFGDPLSIWFNVFCGYYEIDVEVEEWKRPFGYTSDGANRKPKTDDLLRIGKSDWNYFSNYIYGVPEDAIIPCNSLEEPGLSPLSVEKVKIGEKEWDLVSIKNFHVVSPYTAPGGPKLIMNDDIFTPLWQLSYGSPCPRKEFTESFFPTKMKAAFYMTFKKEQDADLNIEAYKTFLFGGTINLDYPELARVKNKSVSIEELEEKNERFLKIQLETAAEVIKTHYRDLGE